MIDLAYSKKTSKRAIFLTICIFVSFLLVVTLFPTQAIAKVRDDIGFQVPENFIENFTSDLSNKFNEFISENKLFNAEENSNDSDDMQSKTNASLTVNNEENDDAGYDSNGTPTFDKDANITYNNKSYAQLSSSNNSISKYVVASDSNANITVNDTDSNSDNSSLDATSDNKTNTTQNVNEQNNSKTPESSFSTENENNTNDEVFVGNDPNWKKVSSSKGDIDNPWWKEKEEVFEKQEEGGSGTKEDPYKVYTKDTLLKLLKRKVAWKKDSNDDKTDDAIAKSYFAHIVLYNDIDMTDIQKINTGNKEKIFEVLPYSDFAGTLDGNGHKIYCNHNVRTPFFRKLENATIKNITFDLSVRSVSKELADARNNQDLNDHLSIVSEIACSGVTAENITTNGNLANRDDSDEFFQKRIGAIFAEARGNNGNSATINLINITNNVSVYGGGSSRHCVGGLIGYASNKACIDFKNCNNNGSVTTFSGNSVILNLIVEIGKIIVLVILGKVFQAIFSNKNKPKKVEVKSNERNTSMFPEDDKKTINKDILNDENTENLKKVKLDKNKITKLKVYNLDKHKYEEITDKGKIEEICNKYNRSINARTPEKKFIFKYEDQDYKFDISKVDKRNLAEFYDWKDDQNQPLKDPHSEYENFDNDKKNEIESLRQKLIKDFHPTQGEYTFTDIFDPSKKFDKLLNEGEWTEDAFIELLKKLHEGKLTEDDFNNLPKDVVELLNQLSNITDFNQKLIDEEYRDDWYKIFDDKNDMNLRDYVYNNKESLYFDDDDITTLKINNIDNDALNDFNNPNTDLYINEQDINNVIDFVNEADAYENYEGLEEKEIRDIIGKDIKDLDNKLDKVIIIRDNKSYHDINAAYDVNKNVFHKQFEYTPKYEKQGYCPETIDNLYNKGKIDKHVVGIPDIVTTNKKVPNFNTVRDLFSINGEYNGFDDLHIKIGDVPKPSETCRFALLTKILMSEKLNDWKDPVDENGNILDWNKLTFTQQNKYLLKWIKDSDADYRSDLRNMIFTYRDASNDKNIICERVRGGIDEWCANTLSAIDDLCELAEISDELWKQEDCKMNEAFKTDVWKKFTTRWGCNNKWDVSYSFKAIFERCPIINREENNVFTINPYYIAQYCDSYTTDGPTNLEDFTCIKATDQLGILKSWKKITEHVNNIFYSELGNWGKHLINRAFGFVLFDTNDKCLKGLQYATAALRFLFLSQYTNINDKINPWSYLIRKLNYKTYTNMYNQKVGKFTINHDVSESIKDSIKQLKEITSDNPNAQYYAGTSIMDDLSKINVSDENLSNSSIYKKLNSVYGELFSKRLNYLTGHSELFWNIFNQDKNSTNDEIKNLESTDDYLAMQGRLISENKNPVANILNYTEYENFKKAENVVNIINQIKTLYKQPKLDRASIYNACINLGKEYCKSCSEKNGVKVQNLAYTLDDVKVCVNYQRIFKEACEELYLEERNITESFTNSLNEGKTSKGSTLIRNFMNGMYKDLWEWTDFTCEWGNKLFDKFVDKFFESNIFDEKFKDATYEEKLLLAKHFFNTYITYSGEFSYNNYLPLTRASILVDSADIYKVDFLYTNKLTENSGLSNYVPFNENWKYSRNFTAYVHPIPMCVAEECSLYKSKDNIEDMFSKDNEDSIQTNEQNNINTYIDPSQLGANMNSISGSNLYKNMENLTKILQQYTFNLPNTGDSWNQVHFFGTSGGFIGLAEDSTIHISKSCNNGDIIGGDYAGGYIGYVRGKSSLTLDSLSNLGSVSACDQTEHHPTAGGFIGEVEDSNINVQINKSLNCGCVVSRRAAGGFVGTAKGSYQINYCASVCGVGSPRYCGGYFGIAEKANSIIVDSSYSCCVFDANTNAERNFNYISAALGPLGFAFPTFPIDTTNSESYENAPGAFCGNISNVVKGVNSGLSNNKFNISNFYYKQGDDFIGNNQNDKLTDFVKSNIHETSLDNFSNGAVCYKLNQKNNSMNEQVDYSEDEEKPFGQIIDNFNYGKKNYMPIPGSTAQVYKNKGSQTAEYTNFDSEYIKLYNVSFNCNHATVNPDVSNIKVKQGGCLVFDIKADDAYQINKFVCTESGKEKNAYLIQGSKYELLLCILNVEGNVTISVDTEDRDIVKPKGSGLDYDPYLIYNAHELHWYNETMKQNCNTNAHVKLMADIDFSPYKWSPIFSAREGMGFSGVFDGNGHKISNIVVDSQNSESGAFFNGVEGDNNVGVLMTKSDVTKSLDDILKDENSKIAIQSDRTDFVYYLMSRFRDKCDISKKIVYCSAVQGKTSEEVCLQKLRNHEDGVILTYLPTKNTRSTYSDVKFIDISNRSGIVKNLTLQGNFQDAVFAKSAREAKFINCIAQGNLSGSGKCCGGIVAYASKNIEITNCINYANISFNARTSYHPSCGGIVGCITSLKYIYNDAANSKNINQSYNATNFIDAEIKGCINYGYIGSSCVSDTVETGGIVGSVSEVDCSVDSNDNFGTNQTNTDESYNLDLAYVKIEKCCNAANIGDPNNTHFLNGAGILAYSGYLNCKQQYHTDIIDCVNHGHIGADNTNRETGIYIASPILGDSSNNCNINDNNRSKKYDTSNINFETITDFNDMYNDGNQIFNCINYGEINKLGSTSHSGQLCGYQGNGLLSISNCVADNNNIDVIDGLKDENSAVSINNIYCRKNIKKNNISSKLIKNDRHYYDDNDLQNGKLTCMLCNVNLESVKGHVPAYGQNIDVLKKDGKTYERQFKPCLLDANTQRVYEKNELKYYSKFIDDQVLYTNDASLSNSEELDKDNSYKININVENENEKVFDTSYGIVEGYTRVKKDSKGSAYATFSIYGKNKNVLNTLDLNGINKDTNNSNKFTFNIEKFNDTFYVDHNPVKTQVSVDEDGFTCFNLNVKFSTEKKPLFSGDSYLISNIYELKWYAKNFDNVEVCSKDSQNDKGVWNARLTSNITIADDDIEPIGSYGHEYTGEFHGSYENVSYSQFFQIENTSSKPIFGVLGSNSKIDNMIVKVNYNGDDTWTSALAEKAQGQNINISNVYVNGNVSGENDKEKENSNSTAAAFVSCVENLDDDNPSSIYLKDCNNNLNISRSVGNAAGFIAKNNLGKVSIDNCFNSGQIINNSNLKSKNAGAIAYCIDNVQDLSDNNEKNININAFKNTGSIKSEKDVIGSNIGANGGVVGVYEVSINAKKQFDTETLILHLESCVNASEILSTSNVGGLIGSLYFSSKQNNNKYNIELLGCENNSKLSLGNGKNQDSSIGGLIGFVSDNFNINFNKCLNSCDDFKINNSMNAGGFIGHLSGNNNVKFNNSSSYIESISAENRNEKINIGGSIGYCPNNINKDNIEQNNFYYLDTQNADHINFIGNFENQNANDYSKKSKDDFESGLVAYEINNETINTSNNKPINIGQLIDLNGGFSEKSPHFNSAKVYKHDSDELYSNYENNSNTDKTIFQVSYDKDSIVSSQKTNVLFDNNETSWLLDIDKNKSNYPLKFIKINDYEFSQESKPFSLYDLNNSTLIESPFVSDYKIDLRKLDSVMKQNTNNSIIKQGLNKIVISYAEFVEPHVIDYKYGNDTEKAYAITTPQELIWFFDTNSNNRVTNNVVICNDIDMSGYLWKNSLSYSDGKFYGNGYKILNVKGNCDAFICNAYNAQFKDFELNVNFSGNNVSSALIKTANNLVSVEGVTVSGIVASKQKCNNFGSIIGESKGSASYSSNCVFSNNYEENEADCFSDKRGNRISNCVNNLSSVSFAWGYATWGSNGGIVGKLADSSFLSINGCTNNYKVQSSNGLGSEDVAGGILGYIPNKNCTVSIYSCINNAEIFGYYAGGIFGCYHDSESKTNSANINIRYCENNGKIGGVVCGGIIGANAYANGANKNIDKAVIFSVDNCINKGNVQCKLIDNGYWCDGFNRAGGIIGLIWDGSNSNENSITYISNCANVGIVNVNGTQPCGGIVGFEDSCWQLHVYNSYTSDSVYGDEPDYVNGIVGCCDDDDNTYFANVYVVGPNNLKNARNDDDDITYLCKNNPIPVFSNQSYSNMLNGRLCYLLNQNHYTSDSAQRTFQTDNNIKYLKGKSSFGQAIDNKNINECSKVYPEPNKLSDNEVYFIGNTTKKQSSNDGFAAYDESSNIFNTLYNTKDDSHGLLYSNFEKSNIGIHVNTWNYKQYNNNLVYQDFKNYGTMCIMDVDGSINDFDGCNNDCAKALACDYSGYYSLKSQDTNETRAYNFVFQPTDGCFISWIAVDGVIRDKSKYIYDGKDENGYRYNIIRSSELEDGKSHTIDVGFSDSIQPDKVDGYYQITNYSELVWFANHVGLEIENGNEVDYSSDCAKLLNDIEASFSISNGGWTSIGTYNRKFSGVIDGCGHKIIGLSRRADDHTAFIRRGYGCTVKNLILESVNFESTNVREDEDRDSRFDDGGGEGQFCAALIACAENVNIDNVEVSGTIKSAGQRMAGLIASIIKSDKRNSNNIKNCVNKISPSEASCDQGHVGGIVGRIERDTTTNIENCTNHGFIKSNKYKEGAADWMTDYAGGIVGYCNSYNGSILNIRNCNNFGKVLGDTSGGICGEFEDALVYTSNKGASLKIQGCNNYAAISGDYTGGILGRINDSSINSGYNCIEWCNNFGYIGNPAYKLRNVGGIVGLLNDGDIKLDINYCSNYGLAFAGGGYETNKSMGILDGVSKGFSVVGMGLGIAAGAMAVVCLIPGGAFILAAAILVSLVFIIDQIFNVVQNRSAVTCNAGGVIGSIKSVEKINMSNVYNFGETSANDNSCGIATTEDTDIKDKLNCNNVYSVSSYSNSDMSNSKIYSSLSNIHFVANQEIKSGKVAYDVQQSGGAGKYYKEGVLVTSNEDKNTITKKLDETNTTTYFGQNLDKYTANDPISGIPIYYYTNNDYQIYAIRANDEPSSKILFYSNYNDYKKILEQGFTQLQLNGNLDTNDDKNDSNDGELNNDDNLENINPVSDEIADVSDNQNPSIESDEAADENEMKSTENTVKERISDYDKLKNYFNIEVRGSRSAGNINELDIENSNDTDNDNTFLKKYNIFPDEEIDIVFTPKRNNGKNYSIKDISSPFTTDYGTKFYKITTNDKNQIYYEEISSLNGSTGLKVEWGIKKTVTDDGSIKVIINPKYIVTKEHPEGINPSCDMETIYKVDGSVETHIYTPIEKLSKLELNIEISPEPAHIEMVSDTNAKQIFLPYTESDKLPNTGGAYYLTKDIEIDRNWNVNSKVYLCLNGHKIKFTNCSCVNLLEENSNLQICDCKYYKGISKWRIINTSDTSYEVEKTDQNSGDDIIDGGFIYSDKYSYGELFKLGKDAKLRIDNAPIFQRNDNSSVIVVMDDNENCKYDLVLNSKIYEAKDVVKYSEHYMNVCFVNFKFGSKKELSLEDLCESRIFFGPKYEHCSFVDSRPDVDPDLLIHSNFTSYNIDFADTYKFVKPITVFSSPMISSNNSCINLTTKFDRFVKKGIKSSDAFKVFSLQNKKTLAYTSLEDIKKIQVEKFKNEGINDSEINYEVFDDNTFNNVCLLNKNPWDDEYRPEPVKLNVEGLGNVYPCIATDIKDKDESENNDIDLSNQELSYKKGSKLKYYYKAQELSFMDYLRCYKTTPSDCLFSVNNNQTNVRENSSMVSAEVIDRNINGSGSFVVNNMNIAKGDNLKFENVEGAQINGFANNDIDTDTEIKAKFTCVKDAAASEENTILWDNPDRFPYEDELYEHDKYTIKLNTDMFINNTWTVPKKIISLDLNGHSVTVDKNSESVKNENIIKLNSSSTVLSVYDSALKNPDNCIERSFKIGKDGQYIQLNSQEDNDVLNPHNEESSDASLNEKIVKIKGGVIYGANTLKNYYFGTDLSAGAILVNNGALNFISGSIACNSSTGRTGGSAITNKENGKVFIYNTANISHNAITGEPKYLNNNFAAAIASEGYLYNDGVIEYNEAKEFASSAVTVYKGKFDNNGSITNNLSYKDVSENSNSNKNSFGAVLVCEDAKFNNTGTIFENKSNFSCPAVAIKGLMTIDGDSKIFNNKWSENLDEAKDSDKWIKYDINLNSKNSIKIESKFNVNKDCVSVVKQENAEQSITYGWSRLALTNYIEQAFTALSDDDYHFVLVHDTDDEIRYTTESESCKLDIIYISDANESRESKDVTCNINTNDRYLINTDYDISLNLDKAYSLSGLKIANKTIDIKSVTDNKFTENFEVWNDSSDNNGTKVIPVYISYEKVDEVINYKYNPQIPEDVTNWDSDNSLPSTENAKVRLTKNIILNDTWYSPVNCYIDLNGYSITINKENKNIIVVDKENSNLIINDTNRNSVHYINKDWYEDKYSFTNNNRNSYNALPIYGGIIGGASFNDENSLDKTGAIHVEKGNLNIAGGNIVANNLFSKESGKDATKGKGSSAIYVAKGASATFGNNVNISYNYSQCSSEQKFEYGAAGLEVRGKCESWASISNNTCNYNSVAGVAVIGEGSSFINYGNIVQNSANNNSVGGILMCSDNIQNLVSDEVNAINYGKIADNTANNNSIAAIELYGKLLNCGKIYKNTASDTDENQHSLAGIYALGNLTLNDESQINQNVYIHKDANKKSEPQDIIFDEDKYDPYVIGSKEHLALFTLGDKYNPPNSYYTNLGDPTPKPRSMTHVSVKNYGEKDFYNNAENDTKPLLLARNFRFGGENNLQKINQYFDVVDENYSICVNKNGEIYYNSKDKNANLYVNTNSTTMGEVNCLGITSTPIGQENTINVPLTVKANEGYRIESITEENIDDQTVTQYPITDDKYFTKEIINNAQMKIININFTTAKNGVNFKTDFEDITKNSSQNIAYEDFPSQQGFDLMTYLPSVSTNKTKAIRLKCDVVLDNTWILGEGTTCHLDLNGHNITKSSGLKGPMIYTAKTAILEIVNSKKDVTDTKQVSKISFSKNPNTGMYERDNNGSVTYYGGCIYGGYNQIQENNTFTDIYGKGGAVYCESDSYISFQDTKLIGNYAQLGGAIYAKGQAVIGKNTELIGNNAERGAAVYGVKDSGILLNGTLKNNAASITAGGVYSDGIIELGKDLMISNNSIINENTINNKLSLFEDFVIVKYTYDDESVKEKRGTILVTLGDLVNNENKLVYYKCYDSLPGKENNVLFNIATDDKEFANGIYVFEEDGFHKLLKDPNSGTYIKQPQHWLEDVSEKYSANGR